MYFTKQIQIGKKHPMFSYFDDLCHKANNLYNTTCYYMRQFATAKYAFEEYKPLFANQFEILNLVNTVTEGTKFKPADTSKWLNYSQLDYILKVTNNPDYYGLPTQCNQQIIKNVINDFKSYFESIKQYKTKPSAFTGRPRMPRYKKSGDVCTTTLTNQVCVIKKDGFVKFPYTQQMLNIGRTKLVGRLKSVRVKPSHCGFVVDIVTEEVIDGELILTNNYNEELLTKYKDKTILSERALAIDLGLSNLCTVVNNFGERPFIVNGRVVKSVNQFYNKQIAKYQSIAKTINGLDYTKRMHAITKNRNNRIKDYMHKTTAYIVKYVIEHNVQLVIIGHNNGQKDEISLGHKVNQEFVQMPFNMLIGQLQYKLNKHGIEFIVVEESYTSKSSFEHNDPLPMYGDDVDNSIFTGKRLTRGLYQTNGKRVINADVNGAANMFRKVCPTIDCRDCCVLHNPVRITLY